MVIMTVTVLIFSSTRTQATQDPPSRAGGAELITSDMRRAGESHNRSRQLIAHARVELALIGPRDHSGDRMGHVGLRLITTRRDQIYLFRESEHRRVLWWRLLTGHVELVGKSVPFNRALEQWRAQDRAVTTYPLLISHSDVQSLYRSLETRIHGRSISPRYELLTSRDATLIRALIDEVTRGAISRALVARRQSAVSWRDELRFSYARAPLAALSLELALGRGLDQERSLWELSAAPRHLIRLLHEVRYDKQSLLGPERQFHISSSASSAGGIFHHIHVLICSIMILCFFVARRASPVISLSKLKTQRSISHRMVINISAVALGCLGMLACWLSWQSDWLEARQSWLLWLTSPADLVLCLRKEQLSVHQLTWRIRYLTMRGAVSALITITLALSLKTTPTLSSLSIAFIFWMSALRGLKSLRVDVARTNHNQPNAGSPDLTATSQMEEVPWL